MKTNYNDDRPLSSRIIKIALYVKTNNAYVTVFENNYIENKSAFDKYESYKVSCINAGNRMEKEIIDRIGNRDTISFKFYVVEEEFMVILTV